MARVLWLADVLRAAGLTVVEHDGWRSRGFQPWAPRYGVVHATAAPRSQSDATQVAIVRDGHSKLQGPIANAVVDRSGRWHVVASGRCNTALTGWAGPAEGLGNEHLLGVEACNDNRGEPWPDVQYQAYVRGWAAICRRLDWGADRCVGHKEHQPGSKTDPTFDMDAFRAAVARLIEEDDMDQNDLLKHTRFNLAYIWRNTWRDARQASEQLAEIRATLRTLAGEDQAAVLRQELDRHRATLLATLGEALAEEVLAGLREQLGDVPDERLVAAAEAGTRRALGSLDEPPAEEDPA